MVDLLNHFGGIDQNLLKWGLVVGEENSRRREFFSSQEKVQVGRARKLTGFP